MSQPTIATNIIAALMRRAGMRTLEFSTSELERTLGTRITIMHDVLADKFGVVMEEPRKVIDAVLVPGNDQVH